MKTLVSIAKPVSWLSLLLIVVPPILFLSGSIAQPLMNNIMLTGTILWFATASLWMKSE
jgi:hypothetical protein